MNTARYYWIIAMSNIEARGSKARDSSDWNHAWSVVSQLAAARGTTLREAGEDKRDSIRVSAIDPTPGESGARSDSTAILPAPFAPIAPDQLARDIAEIERAAAALRRAEPALEPRAPSPRAGSEPRTPRSIWLVVGVIWLTAVAVVSCAIGTMVLLLG
jgi:hypothetical protein